jgi:hypothetical protein
MILSPASATRAIILCLLKSGGVAYGSGGVKKTYLASWMRSPLATLDDRHGFRRQEIPKGHSMIQDLLALISFFLMNTSSVISYHKAILT